MNRYIIGIGVILLVVPAAWLFHKSNSLPAGVPADGGLAAISPSDDVNTKMRKMAEQAVIDAWKYNQVLLDYSAESVGKVETILAVRQKWYAEKNFMDKDIRAEALILSAYIGEVIRRQHGGTWSEDDDVSGPGSYPLKWGKTTSYPYAWCYKRLTQGPDDNVWHKYLYFVRNETPTGVKIEITKYTIGTKAQHAPANAPPAGR